MSSVRHPAFALRRVPEDCDEAPILCVYDAIRAIRRRRTDRAPRRRRNADGGQILRCRRRRVRREVRQESRRFAAIAVKARKGAANNPYAVFRGPITIDEVLASPHICGPLTRPQCCLPSYGAAAALLCSEEFAHKHGMRTDVAINAQMLTADSPTAFDGDIAHLVGCDMARVAVHTVYEQSGVAPEDIHVVELHDCFTKKDQSRRQSRTSRRHRRHNPARPPRGRPGNPVEAAGAVNLLCTPESDYISGQTLVCAGVPAG